MEDVGGKIKGSLQVGFIGVLSRFGMAGIPFRRPAMGMASGNFLYIISMILGSTALGR